MKKLRSILIQGLPIIIIFALVLVYDYKKPDCVEAQTCVSVWSSIQTQSQSVSCNKCGSSSLSMTSRLNQFCFLKSVEIGDMGGGNDRAKCEISGTTVTASTVDDGIANCTAVCINFI